MARKSKSRGRNLKRTETQAQLDISRYVSNERGRTNGVYKLGAVSAAKPRLPQQSSCEYPRLMPKPLDAIQLELYIATVTTWKGGE